MLTFVTRTHRATGRDISEKIALGLAKPTVSKDSMLDARLFNREQYSASFGDEDSYNLYDKPLFSGSSAAAAIYKPRGRNVDDEGYEVDQGEVEKAMRNDRFGLGVAGSGRGFEGADTSEVRDGCVFCFLPFLTHRGKEVVADLGVFPLSLLSWIDQTRCVRARYGRSVRCRRVPRVGEARWRSGREEARPRHRRGRAAQARTR